jgi:dTDP-4-amino-4,6-dideoxygalactose transaminase
LPEGVTSIWAQYTLRTQNTAQRDYIMSELKKAYIPTAIYYPKPLHQQTAYTAFPRDPEGLPNSELAATTVFSLPISAYLTEQDQDHVIATLIAK